MCCGETVIDCNTCEGDGDRLCECSDCGCTHLARCQYCNGSGLEPCGTCDGKGRIPKSDYRRELEGQINFLADDELPF